MWVYEGRTAGRVRKDALPDHLSSSAASECGAAKAECSDWFGSARRGSAGFGLRSAGSRAGW